MKSHIVKKVLVKILDFNLFFGPFPKTQWYPFKKVQETHNKTLNKGFSTHNAQCTEK